MTFAELGAPFPLFAAPVDDASGFVGRDRCSLCGQDQQACFELGIGCAVIRTCPKCNTPNGLDADDGEATECRNCKASIPFPDLPDQIVACYECLRAGRAAITKDTELGMVSWEQAFEGVTHGSPGLDHADFELVPHEGSDWVGARVPQAVLFELLRTPCYATIQGDRWLFCCKEPMVFVGCWERDHFTRESPDGDGKAYLAAVIGEHVQGLWEDELHDTTGIYVFRCATCRRVRGHWDIA